MSTQTQRVYDAIANAGFAIQHCEIADRTGDPQASVRRTVYNLVKAGKVAVRDNGGFPYGSPRFIVAPTQTNG